MPKDHEVRQNFPNEPWKDSSTYAGAGKVQIVAVASGVQIGFDPSSAGSAALPADKNLATTAWNTLVDPGSDNAEIVGIAWGNYGVTFTRIKFRFATGTSYIWPGVPTDGGAFNWNFIGHKWREPGSPTGRDFQVKCTTKTKVQVFAFYRTY